MSLHRTAAKRDDNEKAVVDALRAHGCSVERLSGRGCPDLLIARQGMLVALAEVKARRGSFTPAQIKWRQEWRGPVPVILRSVSDAIQLVRFGPAGLET